MNDLSRGRRSPVSRDAFERIRPFRKIDANLLLNTLRLQGPMTSKELVLATGMPLQSVSGRLSELKTARLVQGTRERRDGAEVIEALSKQAVLA